MTKKLTIAAITPFPPSPDGIADYSAKLVKAIERANSNAEVTLYSFKKDGTSRKGQYAMLSYNPFGWRRMYKKVTQGRPDVLHVQFDVSNYMLLIIPLAITLFFIKRRGATKLLATYHEAYRDRELYGILAVIFYPLFNRLFERIYVHTHLSEEALRTTFKAPAQKVVCIPHGTSEFVSKTIIHKEQRQRYNAHGRIILSFGYIYRSKGLEYLVDALRLLKESGQVMPTVLIAGKVPRRKGVLKIFQYRNQRYLAGLKAQIQSAGLNEHVRFIGFVPSEELYSLFTLANVTVLPYISVDQSGVLNTAIGAHAPVIASDIGGIKETLAQTGIIVPPRDSAAIYKALKKVLYDDTLQSELSAAYRQLAQRLDTNVVTETLLKDYEKIVNNG